MQENNHKIAILQYEWPIQSHTVNLATELSKSGYEVDLFLKGCPSSFINMSKHETNSNVNIIDLSYVLEGNSGFISFVNRLINLLYIIKDIISYSPIPSRIVKKTLGLMKGKYKCIIGIEKRGLIWACEIGTIVNVPYLYYSLELYLEDHPAFKHSREFIKLRKAEIKAHLGVRATVIQDEKRANVLFDYNRIMTDTILLPISISRQNMNTKSLFLQNRHSIQNNKCIILYMGVMDEDRGTIELVKVMRKMPPNVVLVLHGYGDPKFIGKLKKEITGINIFLSTELVAEKDLADLVSSAHIGLAFYSNDCSNNRLTAFSSEKIAMYLRSGLPIVSFNIGNYPDLINRHKCGELIDNMDELPVAIGKIINSYKDYSMEALNAYNDLYDYHKNYHRLEAYINNLKD